MFYVYIFVTVKRKDQQTIKLKYKKGRKKKNSSRLEWMSSHNSCVFIAIDVIMHSIAETESGRKTKRVRILHSPVFQITKYNGYDYIGHIE